MRQSRLDYRRAKRILKCVTGRKVKILALGGLAAGLLVLGVGIWILARATSDEARYRALLSEGVWWERVMFTRRDVIDLLGLRIRICNYLQKRFEDDRKKLLASGYLTNLLVEATSGPANQGKIIRQLDSVTGVRFFDIVCQSNSLTITCRARDVERLRKAMAD